jgi:cardiolipin synthase
MRRPRLTKQRLSIIWKKLREHWHLRWHYPIQHPPEPYVSEAVSVGENRLTLFNRGQEVYEAMLELFENAHEEILIDSFIFSSDEIGERMQDVLLRKKQEGVKVTILMDPIGCFSTLPKFWNDFRKHRIRILPVNHYWNPWNLLTLKFLFRDHRKLVIIDGKVGFLGGLNISKRYEVNWRDSHLMIEGPAAEELRALFYEVAKRKERKKRLSTLREKHIGVDSITCLNSFPRERIHRLLQILIGIISQAREEIIVSHLYFIPVFDLKSALFAAVERGVKVKVLFSEKSDIASVHKVVKSGVRELLRKGVEVWWYEPCVNHSKTMLIDRQYSFIGSANFNHQSFTKNYEITAIIKSEKFGATMHDLFEKDFAKARQETLEHWNSRPISIQLFELFLGRFQWFI